jgi:hypothetical protein
MRVEQLVRFFVEHRVFWVPGARGRQRLGRQHRPRRLVGGLLPLALKRLRLDPALVSGPLLTTVTDMCGFFRVLSFATALLPRLA